MYLLSVFQHIFLDADKILSCRTSGQISSGAVASFSVCSINLMKESSSSNNVFFHSSEIPGFAKQLAMVEVFTFCHSN